MLHDQAEMLFDSIAFWERQVSALSNEATTEESELSYCLTKLQYDMREMEKVDHICRKFVEKQKIHQKRKDD